MSAYKSGGTFFINGKPAEHCTCAERGVEPDICTLYGCFIPYLCPECGAHLSKSGICLNACHLTAEQYRRFHNGIVEATARVDLASKQDH